MDILLLNVLMGYTFYSGYLSGNKIIPVSVSEKANNVIYPNGCDTNCQNTLREEINSLKKELMEVKNAPSPTSTPEKSTISIPTNTKIKDVSYLPIPGTGSTLNTYWTEVGGTDFYISKSDYQGLTGVYFEANMKLVNGNGKAYLRIYDVTNGRGVDGSEISTNSQTSVFVGSGAINLWEGNNHYIVQAKSLTSDTTVFESGRLKMITEN